MQRQSDAEMGVDGESWEVPHAFDFEEVRAVRAYREDDGRTIGAKTVLTFVDSDELVVCAPYAVVFAAWRAWRAHADQIRRLTN